MPTASKSSGFCVCVCLLSQTQLDAVHRSSQVRRPPQEILASWLTCPQDHINGPATGSTRAYQIAGLLVSPALLSAHAVSTSSLTVATAAQSAKLPQACLAGSSPIPSGCVVAPPVSAATPLQTLYNIVSHLKDACAGCQQ